MVLPPPILHHLFFAASKARIGLARHWGNYLSLLAPHAAWSKCHIASHPCSQQGERRRSTSKRPLPFAFGLRKLCYSHMGTRRGKVDPLSSWTHSFSYTHVRACHEILEGSP
jgi:hypothetical protein